MLPSYLDEGVPTVAEIAGNGGHQRQKLSAQALKHGPVDIRDWSMWFDLRTLRKLLRDTDAKIIDVAFSCGYTDPRSLYSRAFRRDFRHRRHGSFVSNGDHGKPAPSTDLPSATTFP